RRAHQLVRVRRNQRRRRVAEAVAPHLDCRGPQRRGPRHAQAAAAAHRRVHRHPPVRVPGRRQRGGARRQRPHYRQHRPARRGAGTPRLASDVTFMDGVWIEAVLTFFLVSAVFGTAVSSEAPKIGGFGIGLAIFVAALVGGSLTGAVMNPARAIGPALVAWQWNAHAVYWIGPLIGAGVAAALWRVLLLPRG